MALSSASYRGIPSTGTASACVLARQRGEVEEDGGVAHFLRLGVVDPVPDPGLPVAQPAAPQGVVGHHLAVAEGVADAAEGSDDLFGQGDEEGLDLRHPGVGDVLEDETVVLVRAEQHLPAAAAAHDEETVADVRPSLPRRLHLFQADFVHPPDDAVMDVGEDLHHLRRAARLREEAGHRSTTGGRAGWSR